MDALIDADAARKLLAVLRADVLRARNRADAGGEVQELARVVELALRGLPEARVFAERSARRELAAFDPGVAAELERWFEAPFGREARVRGAVAAARGKIAKAEVGIGGLMRAYRAHDESERRNARVELDRVLDDLYDSTAVREIMDRSDSGSSPSSSAASAYGVPSRAAFGSAPASPPADAKSASGLLVLPSAELVQGLAGGATLDPALLATLAAAPAISPTPEPVDVSATSPAAAPAATGELLRALAESVLGSSPESFGAWRSACAAFHVADFRVAPLPLLGRTNTRALPFEHPAVPLARTGAIPETDVDAWSTAASLFGAARELGGDALAGAFLLTTATRAFVMRALADRPSDPARASRAFALGAAFRFAASQIDATDADTLRAGYDDVLGASPPSALARWWSAEPRLAALPGEEATMYVHTSALSRALLRGVQLAATLRDTHDEDWFRNPRLTADRLRELAAISREASAPTLLDWVREHARL